MNTQHKAKLNIILAMAIFGTIGIFRRYIPMTSEAIADLRGLIGVLFLAVYMSLRKLRPDFSGMKRNLLPLLLGGSALGINWILLFEAYNYTTVAAATLCYNMAPVILILLSPVLFGERLTWRKVVCSALAVLGIVLVTGVSGTGASSGSLKGILLGLASALFYASVVTINRKITGLGGLDRTLAELSISTLILALYILAGKGLSAYALLPSPRVSVPLALLLLLIVGILHTGVAYTLYFGSMNDIPAQSLALFSYVDPVLAVLLSALLLREPLGFTGILGAVLVLGATAISERTA